MIRQLVTLRQALELRTWTTEPFLRRAVKEKRIAYHKAGGKLLFDLADIDAYAEAGRVEPPAPFQARRSARRSA